MEQIRRRAVKNVDAALMAYYGPGYIDNKTIGVIFGTKTASTIYKLKLPVMAEERKRNIPVVVPHHVNVKVAFEVWGIDVKELERNKKKLEELNLA